MEETLTVYLFEQCAESFIDKFLCDGGGSVNASREFKQMVKSLHSAGIEVVMLIFP